MGQYEEAAAARAAAQHASRQRQLVSALEEERRGYVVRGLGDRVAAVDEQLTAARARVTLGQILDGQPTLLVEDNAPQRPRGRRSAKDELARLEGPADGESDAEGTGGD